MYDTRQKGVKHVVSIATRNQPHGCHYGQISKYTSEFSGYWIQVNRSLDVFVVVVVDVFLVVLWVFWEF